MRERRVTRMLQTHDRRVTVLSVRSGDLVWDCQMLIIGIARSAAGPLCCILGNQQAVWLREW